MTVPPSPIDPPTVLQLRSPDGLVLTLMDQGATWLSCTVALPGGEQREVLLGGAFPTEHARQPAYMGATIGRYANRIRNARISRDGQSWELAKNPPGSRHQLHGGPMGFDHCRWTIAARSASEVSLTLVSPDGDMGYPGQLDARVTYRVTASRTGQASQAGQASHQASHAGQAGLAGPSIEMECLARTSAPTPVCLTNHAYFNLDPVPDDVRAHHLQIRAAHYLPVDEELIPLGPLESVAGSGFDFRQPKRVRQDWLRDAQQTHAGGYDHAFLLDPQCVSLGAPAAVLEASDARLTMELYTTLPALQFYAGQLLAGTASRNSVPYAACAGLALEPQFLPDSPNHPEWPQPSCWLLPGQTYRQRIIYRFVAGPARAANVR